MGGEKAGNNMRVVSLSPLIRCLSCGAQVPREAENCGDCGANLSEQTAFALPLSSKIGHYEIDYILGRGGFGITYRAIDHLLGRYVAIKEFFPVEWAWRAGQDSRVSVAAADRAPFDKALQKFAEEGKILANLSHPNIVRIYTLLQEHNTLYLVMELLEGMTLAQVLRTQKPFPEERARRIAKSLAGALHTIHKLGLQHLDIKPENIMLTGDGRTVLFDFGAARWDLERGASRTRTIVAFTPGYAPLELLQGTRARTSPATDIYELSVVIYEMLSGQLPPDPIQRLSNPDWQPDVPPHWKPLLQAGLQVQMTQRPQSVAEWWKLYDPTPLSRPAQKHPIKLPTLPKFPFTLKNLRLPLSILTILAIAAFFIDPLLLPHRARQSVQNGNLPHAIALYTRAIQFAPHDPQLRQERAAIHYTLKNYRAATEDWEEAYRLSPSPQLQLTLADAYFAWGEQLLDQGRRTEARAVFDKAQEYNPALADRIKGRMMDAIILAAQLAVQKGDLPGGISLYKEALQSPNLPLPLVQRLRQELADALRQQAEQQLDNGDIEGAIATLSTAIAENPNNPTLLRLRGDAFSKKLEYQKAIADYSHSIQLDPNIASAYAGRAKALSAQGKPREALTDYDQAIQLGDAKPEIYTAKALTLYQLQSFIDALKAFNSALALDPRHNPALLGRGWTYFALQNYPAAINDFDQSLLYQESPAAHHGLGYAKTLLKDSPQAILTHLQKAIELYQNQPHKIKEIQDWIKKHNLTP